MVCYDGARLTARSFADMKKSASLLVTSLTHPTRLLTLRSSNPSLLAGTRRSIQHNPRLSSTASAATPSSQVQAPPAEMQSTSDSTQQQQAHQASVIAEPEAVQRSEKQSVNSAQYSQAHQVRADPMPEVAQSSRQQPGSGSGQHQHAPSLETGDGLMRQLSFDTAKDQHVYQSWSRAGNLAQLQGMGPVVNAQTIPAKGANAEGVSAQRLHISVRRHYKEKGGHSLLARRCGLWLCQTGCDATSHEHGSCT